MDRLKARRMGRMDKRKREIVNVNDDDDLVNSKEIKKQKIRDNATHESYSRIIIAKRNVRLKHLNKTIEDEENKLKSMYPKSVRDEIEKEKRDEIVNQKYKLTGAARPAIEVYPEYYPEFYKAKRQKEIDREASRENFLEKYKGDYSLHEETRKLLGFKLQLGFEYLSESSGNRKASNILKKVLECDTADSFGARFGLIFASIDCGDLSSARSTIIDIKSSFDSKDVPPEVYWALVIIEYISFAVLQEEGSDGDAADKALKEALEKNPYIPILFKNYKKLEKVVDPEETEQEVRLHRISKLTSLYNASFSPSDRFVGTLTAGLLPYGSFEEAIILFLNQISCWKDAEGSLEWLENSSKSLLKSNKNPVELTSVKLNKDLKFSALAAKCLKSLLS